MPVRTNCVTFGRLVGTRTCTARQHALVTCLRTSRIDGLALKVLACLFLSTMMKLVLVTGLALTVEAWAPGARRPSNVVNPKRSRPVSTTAMAETLCADAPTAVEAPLRKPKKRSVQHTVSDGSGAGLRRDEEIHYSFQIRTLRAAMRLRDQITAESFLPPSEAEWAEACGTSVLDLRRVIHEGKVARESITRSNVGLVTAVARRHYAALKSATEAGGGVGTILTLQDMIQEGNLGLMEAAERFEPEKGFRFSTYAVWWIRSRILRAISDSSRIIRLPAHVHSTLGKIAKTRAQLAAELGYSPSTEELAAALHMSEEQLQHSMASSRNVVSLELPLRAASSKEDRRTLGDVVASDAPTPEEDAEADYLRRDIWAVLEYELAERERDVIAMRFGLESGRPSTVEETAKQLGISRDRVRLFEARALNKLRSPQRNYRLKEYISGEGGMETLVDTTPLKKSSKSDRIWFF